MKLVLGSKTLGALRDFDRESFSPLLENRHKAMYQTALLQIIRMHLIKLHARKRTDRVIAREIPGRADGGNLQREAGRLQLASARSTVEAVGEA